MSEQEVFAPGDRVVFSDEDDKSSLAKLVIENRYGAGPFEVVSVIPVTEYASDAGHPQSLTLKDPQGSILHRTLEPAVIARFSGWFFRKLG